MTNEKELFHLALKKTGNSITKTRNLIFEALLDKEPQSVSELYHQLSDQLDRASLYRAIVLFEKLGIVQRLQIGWKYKIELSDTYNHHHHHITCIRCGMTIPIREDLTLEAGIKSLANEYGFSDVNHQLEIRGVCGKCQKS